MSLSQMGHLAVAEFGIDMLIERYLEQLMRWGMILTLGDVDLAEESVQDYALASRSVRPT
jgi:hypothetical protein